MMTPQTRATLLMLLVGLCLFLVASCNGGGDDDDDTAATDDDDSTDDDDDDDQVEQGPAIGADHTGWRNPICFDCHDGTQTEYPHQDQAYEPPDCGACHGYNGAIHTDHAADPVANCAECHASGSVMPDHLYDFEIPNQCAQCHVHPESPNGD